MSNPKQDDDMRRVGRKTVPERLTTPQSGTRQRPARVFGPMVAGSTHNMYPSTTHQPRPSVPRYPYAIFGGVGSRAPYITQPMPPHLRQPRAGNYPHTQSRRPSINSSYPFADMSNNLFMDTTPPPRATTPLSPAATVGRKTIDLTRSASQTPLPTAEHPPKGKKCVGSARRVIAGKQPRHHASKQPRHHADKHRVGKATPAHRPSIPGRPRAYRDRSVYQPTEDTHARSKRPPVTCHDSPSPDPTPIPSIEPTTPIPSIEPTTETTTPHPTRRTRLHPFPSPIPPSTLPTTLDPQTGNPIASTYGPYALPPQLHGIRLALGEANWEKYVTLIEGLESGKMTEEEVVRKEGAIYQCGGKGRERERIRGLVRKMVRRGEGREG